MKMSKVRILISKSPAYLRMKERDPTWEPGEQDFDRFKKALEKRERRKMRGK